MRKLAFIAIAAVAVPLVVTPVASASPTYSSCAQARADGRSNIPQGDPDYSPNLDRDGDGIACES